jgi:uncharacterized membrane protein affecting hemolysin expression
MPGFEYLIAAYLIFLVGLLIYFVFIAVRTRQVQTELVAIRQLMQERDEASQGED